MYFNCTMFDIVHAFGNCANTASCPNSVPCATIKQILYLIKHPLLVIFQQSLSQGKFLNLWKRANVIPLFKGKGEQFEASSY